MTSSCVGFADSVCDALFISSNQHQNGERMSTSTSVPLSASVDASNANPTDEPTIVETLEEAVFILNEDPTAAVLIRPKN